MKNARILTALCAGLFALSLTAPALAADQPAGGAAPAAEMGKPAPQKKAETKGAVTKGHKKAHRKNHHKKSHGKKMAKPAPEAAPAPATK